MKKRDNLDSTCEFIGNVGVILVAVSVFLAIMTACDNHVDTDDLPLPSINSASDQSYSLAEKDDRFELLQCGDIGTPMKSYYTYILIDHATGVQYVMLTNGNGTGMTPLLDSDGTPLLYEINNN